ncbi:MAG: hypothetical protein AAF352_02845, partial [Pseudomonadota bacterium]
MQHYDSVATIGATPHLRPSWPLWGRFTLRTKIAIIAGLFILLTEVMILVPSTLRHRQTYLTDLLSRAHLSVLYLQNAPHLHTNTHAIDDALMHNRIWEIRLKENPDGELFVVGDHLEEPHKRTNLDTEYLYEEMIDIIHLFQRKYYYGLVESVSPINEKYHVSVHFDREILAQSVREFVNRIILLSFFIATLTGLVLYVVLTYFLVRPLQKLINNIESFQQSPHDSSLVLQPSNNKDEIGDLERKLSYMETQVTTAFKRQQALVALGGNVTRINHDLRGLLGNVSLLNDQLLDVQDANIHRLASKIDEITERAVSICSRTMDYVRGGEISVQMEAIAWDT